MEGERKSNGERGQGTGRWHTRGGCGWLARGRGVVGALVRSWLKKCTLRPGSEARWVVGQVPPGVGQDTGRARATGALLH